MADLLIGVSAEPGANTDLIHEAGVSWVRQDFPFPFEDRMHGPVSPRYQEAKQQAERWVQADLKVMGVTPLPGIATLQPDPSGRLDWDWQRWAPAWCGKLGSEEFLRSYAGICAWMARDLAGIVPAWQIANELDHPAFLGPLTVRQSSQLLERSAIALRAADPSLFIGQNPSGRDLAYYLLGRLYPPHSSHMDYCGIDGYYGTWAPGGPETWGPRIAEFHELSQTPVLVNEFGFASEGGVMEEEERRSRVHSCQIRKWPHTWGAGHTPQAQAEFVRAAFDQFRAHRSLLVGVFFYRWEDQERCWACGSPDCPMETRWGLVDIAGQPKPSYHAFREGVEKLLA